MEKNPTSVPAKTSDMLRVSYISDRVETTKGKLYCGSIAVQLKKYIFMPTDLKLLFFYLSRSGHCHLSFPFPRMYRFYIEP